jgi:single-stranded-DNA-specific exonuclease
MKRWEIVQQFSNHSNNPQQFLQDLTKLLLANRGINHEDDIQSFLHPDLSSVTVAAVGIDTKQLAKAINRIKQAIASGEQIAVFGDYDVDGITGTAILWESLHGSGAKIIPYIPHRVDEGYGLSMKGIDNLLALQVKDGKFDPSQTKLIITVDNGIVAHDAVAYAKEKGIDVIITDHHVRSDTSPDAFAIVHTTKLCGAGVAWLFSNQIKEVLFHKRYDFKTDNHLELACLGTIADMVPLTSANRAIVKHGLTKLCQTTRAGIVALFKDAACEQSTAGVYEVGHVLAPRLNAAGRITSAMDSLRLLCTKDPVRAVMLSQNLNKTNKDRQSYMFEAAKHASSSFRESKSLKKLLFIADENYQQGVIGLVAGRLVEEFYRPAIVLSKGEKYSKASARSVHGFNIIEFLRGASDMLVDVGGHPMAAGFTVETDKLLDLQDALEKLAEEMLDDATLTRSIRIDCDISLSHINWTLYNALQTLSPFGVGNAEPTFVSYTVQVADVRLIGKEGKHMKLFVSQDRSEHFEALAFGMGDRLSDVHTGDTIDIVYTVDENEWNGNKKLQLKVKDFRQSQ